MLDPSRKDGDGRSGDLYFVIHVIPVISLSPFTNDDFAKPCCLYFSVFLVELLRGLAEDIIASAMESALNRPIFDLMTPTFSCGFVRK